MNYIEVKPELFKDLKYEVKVEVLPAVCCCGFTDCIDVECE